MNTKLLQLASLVMLASGGLYAQDIQWEKSYGGRQAEYLFDVQATADYGFILAGSSLSRASGNKTGAANGDLDYWIWKMDEHGTEDWQKSFGGTGSDLLQSVRNTNDGGFILAGTSNSPKGMGKKQDGRGGNDYWIIKLNAKGTEEWQQTYGGSEQDDLLSVSPTRDGGYIVGGSSASAKNGDKATATNGNMDYWILKLDSDGKIEWQKSFGGQYADLLRALSPTRDGGYILGGYSNSPQSAQKASANFGEGGDFWVLKLDSRGEIEWQQTFGGDGDDQLYALQQTTDGGYIAGGNSNSGATGNKNKTNRNGSDFWVLKLDTGGGIVWQETYDFGRVDILSSIIENEDHTFLVGGHAQSEVMGTNKKDREEINDYIALKLSDKGEILWSSSVGSEGEDILRKAIETRDGGYLMAGTSNPEKRDYILSGTEKKDALSGISNGQNLAGVQKAQDEINNSITGAADSANTYIKDQATTATDAVNTAIGQESDSAMKIGMNGPAGSLFNPSNGKGSSGSSDSSASGNAAAAKGPKPGVKSSRSKTMNYGNKDFWVVKIRDKDKKTKEPKTIEAFPNPAFEFTNVIVGFDFNNGTASVYDIAGRQLQSFKVTDRTIPIELGSYPEWIYIVKIATDKGEGSVKIIKGITRN